MGALGGGETQAAEGKGRAEHAARSPPEAAAGAGGEENET